VKNDLRTLATALESYRVDNTGYPFLATYRAIHNQWNRGGIHHCSMLSTPVAYLTTVGYADPLQLGTPDDIGDIWRLNVSYSYHYINIPMLHDEFNSQEEHFADWALMSLGPDYVKGPDAFDGGEWLFSYYGFYSNDPDQARFIAWNYDSSNGTMSLGDILRWQ
jgi:hypothetical protein